MNNKTTWTKNPLPPFDTVALKPIGEEEVSVPAENPGKHQGYLSAREKIRAACGRESVFIILLVVGLGAIQMYAVARISDNFKIMTRKWLFVFLLVAILSWLLALFFIFRTLRFVCSPQKREENAKAKVVVRAKVAKKKRAQSGFRQMKQTYDDVFDVNGKYYLTKMHVSEVAENILQLLNMVTIHLCQMPMVLVAILAFVLITETVFQSWTTFHISSQIQRDRQLLVDIGAEIVCIVLPLGYNFWAFQVPIQTRDSVQLIVYPTVSLLIKTYEIWDDIFVVDTDNARKSTVQARQRRTSILGMEQTKSVIRTQLEHFPKMQRYGFTAVNGSIAFFFAFMIVFQLALEPSDATCLNEYTEEIWNACKVKVPFCEETFTPKCNCAVVHIINFTKPSLPSSFKKLSALRQLGVYTGQLQNLSASFGQNHKKMISLKIIRNKLTTLPSSIGAMNNLVHFWIMDNRLISIPGSIEGLQILNNLNLDNNQLRSLPENVENLEHLVYLSVSGNRLRTLPDGVSNLKLLSSIKAFNNRLTALPKNIGNLKNLIELYLYNNRLSEVPESIGLLQHLTTCYVWNNTLAKLPESVGGMKSLKLVDLRHNELTALPDSIKEWKAVKYFAIAGNPLCPNYNFPSSLPPSEESCKIQCSADCPSTFMANRYHDKSLECNDNDYTYIKLRKFLSSVNPQPGQGCNTANCEFDRGTCKL